MSLEQALAANTAALQALTAALAASGTVRPQPAPSMQPAPTAAPSIVAVAPVPTAPVESMVSSPLPTTAFAPPAQTVPSPVTTVVPPTAPPVVSGSGERDSKGMPYDGRIHSSSKAKVADGSWRYKRGTGETYIAQVEQELRAAMGAPAPVAPQAPAAPVAPQAPAAPVAPQAPAAPVGSPAFGPHPFYDNPNPVVAPPPAAAPAMVPPPPAPVVAAPVQPVTGITTYEALMAALPPKLVSGELSASQMQEACESFGVPSIAALATRPDLVPSIAAMLKL